MLVTLPLIGISMLNSTVHANQSQLHISQPQLSQAKQDLDKRTV